MTEELFECGYDDYIAYKTWGANPLMLPGDEGYSSYLAGWITAEEYYS